MKDQKKKYETICGCYVTTTDGIQFRQFHGQVQAYVSELNFIRGYFLERGGGDASPFVRRIDKLIPRATKE